MDPNKIPETAEGNGSRPRILIAGDAAVPTGFARVIEGIFSPLHEKYDIHHLGTNYHGDPHPLPWKVYPASLGGGVWGTHRLQELIAKIKPQLVFVINDIWVADDYLKALGELDSRPPVVLYCPIDSGPIEREAVLPLHGVERFATYTDFGKLQVQQAVEDAISERADFEFPEIEVIPHGIDTSVFHPFPGESQRQDARAALLPGRDDLQEAFIVLNANRNQPRKRIDVTMEGFARFAADKPESVKLFLHMGTQDQGWDIPTMARRLNIESRLIMSTAESALPYFSTRHLNHVYNACEVGINTSYSEGWGLVSFEHAATRAAQIVPQMGPCGELWEGSALMLEASMKTINQKIMTEGWLIDAETVARELDRLYADPDLLAELSTKAYASATREELTWSTISDRWGAMFAEILGEAAG